MGNYDIAKTQKLASEYAKSFKHAAVTPEHCLLALLRDEKVIDFLEYDSIKINLPVLRKSLIYHLSEMREKPSRKERRDIVPLSREYVELRNLTSDISRAFRNSHEPQSPVDMLIAMLRQQTPAREFLEQEGLTFDFAAEVYREFIPIEDELETLRIEEQQKRAAKEAAEEKKRKEEQERKKAIMNHPKLVKVDPKGALANFCRNLSQDALEGKLDEIAGREGVFDQVIRVLARRRKNNPCLTGDAGVGKTAIAEGLALRILRDEVPEKLRDKNIFMLNVAALVAGTKFRGEFEARAQALVDELSHRKDIILFVDEGHVVAGAGAAEGSLDLSNIFKPALARGDIQMMSATTIEEYNKTIRKDGALKRRMPLVDVPPTNIPETIAALEIQRYKYEEHHGVKIADRALTELVRLADRHLHEVAFPDKAFDLMDEALAEASLQTPPLETVDIPQIHKIIAAKTGLDASHFLDHGAGILLNLEDDLNKRVINQEHVTKKVAARVKRHKSGMADPNKPVGSFLFLGPTGVGKTELVKTYAKRMGLELVRIDMSEYMEKINVSRLIGAAPGYVGYEEGGQLTEPVRKKPHCAILFDEIEKAHPDVFDVLLQVLDEGRLTDSHGRTINFKNTTIFMSSNIQPSQSASAKMGFGTKNASAKQEKLTKHSPELRSSGRFRPEFLNRIDVIESFNEHTPDSMIRLTDIFLAAVHQRAAEKSIGLVVDDTAKKYLAEKGYDKVYGARPMKNLIEDEVTDPISDALIGGKIKEGGIILIHGEKDGLTFAFNNPAPALAMPEQEELPPIPPIPPSAMSPGSLSIN
jgi:ATP-dependent Clp protease ATP-binding subunit ClpA